MSDTVVLDFDSYDDYDDADYDDAPQDDRDEVVVEAAPRRGNRRDRRAQDQRAKRAQSSARRREAEGIELVEVEHNGAAYWIPADPSDWNAAALLAFEDGKAITALRNLIEPDEDGRSGFDRLMATGPRVKELQALFEKVARLGGFESSGN